MTVVGVTNEFIGSVFRGRNIAADGEITRHEIEDRYFGASRKPILVAFRDAQKKYMSCRGGVREGPVES